MKDRQSIPAYTLTFDHYFNSGVSVGDYQEAREFLKLLYLRTGNFTLPVRGAGGMRSLVQTDN